MTASASKSKIESLIEKGEWQAAQELLERELARHPDNHWLLTQLAVALYEQKRYKEALPSLLASLDLVPDCPLTLWNLAGTLDSLGKPKSALPIYSWLLASDKSADDDPCWESQEWTDSLKTDCVYRIGVCFQRLGKWQSAEHCFRQYINLLLAGMNGTYPIEDAARSIRELQGKVKTTNGKEVHAAFASTLRD